jgi:predicted small lipoprotein YifL
MLKVSQILVIALGLSSVVVGITGCGQRGSLYMPTEPAAANRATLPELVIPGARKPSNTAPASATPSNPAAPASDATESAPATLPAEKTTEPTK